MKNNKGFTFVELIVILTVIFIGPILIWLVSLWTESNLNFWIGYFKHTTVYIPYWISLVSTIILNGCIIILNIVAEIAKYLI